MHSPNNVNPNCNFADSLPVQIKELDCNLIVMQAPAAELNALKEIHSMEKQFTEAKKATEQLIKVAIDNLLREADVKIILMDRVPRYVFQYKNHNGRVKYVNLQLI